MILSLGHSSCVVGCAAGSSSWPLVARRFLPPIGVVGQLLFYRHVSRGVWLDRLHPGAAGCPPHVLGQQAILVGLDKIHIHSAGQELHHCPGWCVDGMEDLSGHSCWHSIQWSGCGVVMVTFILVWQGGVLSRVCVRVCAYLLSRLVTTTE